MGVVLSTQGKRCACAIVLAGHSKLFMMSHKRIYPKFKITNITSQIGLMLYEAENTIFKLADQFRQVSFLKSLDTVAPGLR